MAVATYTTEWKYDSHGRLLEMTYPDEEKIVYKYDLGGNLCKVFGKKNYLYTYIDTIAYDLFGQRSFIRYGNGAETRYSYSSNRQRLSNLTVNANNVKVMDNTYKYDVMDNITSLVNAGKPQTLQNGKTIGGSISHAYSYDEWDRLIGAKGTFSGGGSKTATYDLHMEYDKLYNVTSKQLDLKQNNLQFAGTLQTGYELTYNYKEDDPFKLESIDSKQYSADRDGEADTIYRVNSYDFDENGNLTLQLVDTQKDSAHVADTMGTKVKNHLWDEENRLLAINDNGFVSNYFYDASGERTVKLSKPDLFVYVNSSEKLKGDSLPIKFVGYVSPYLVVTNGGRYTKHIYAGTQRIASKLGDINAFGADPRRVATAGHDVDNAEPIDFGTKYKNQNDAFKSRFDSLGAKFNGKSLDDYVNGKSFCCGDKNLDEIEKNNTQSAENAKLEDNLYFYHPDHLGSTSMVTNYDGEVTQNVAYIPYGEVFVEERNGSWATPFLFNAKELDEETGLYYYGARYLDPTDCRWLSVDPVFHPGASPYAYCLGNPVRFSDPTGMWEWDENGNLKAQKGDNSYSMAKFLGTKQKNAMEILKRSGVTANEKGVLNLKEGQILDKSTLWIETKSTSGVVVNNSKEATAHYFCGNGEAADVGDQSTKELLNTDKFKAKHHKITNEKVDLQQGYFSVDMTNLTFHIGRTNVDYDISSNGKSQLVKYSLFTRDGFWDPDFISENILGKLGSKRHQPDGKGPNLERFGGTPYDYKTRELIFFFKPVKVNEPTKVNK